MVALIDGDSIMTIILSYEDSCIALCIASILESMATIAVAGGTSPTLGRSIVKAIGQTPNKAIILSRENGSKFSGSDKVHGAEVRYVNYSSHDSLVRALGGVETVISVLKIHGPEFRDYQINLLNAAKDAGVKRFAPSEFELGPLADGAVDALGLKPPIWEACHASGLECARFSCGMFMNYLSLGSDRLDSEVKKDQMLYGLEDEPIIWNVRDRNAELPLKDDDTYPKITLTEISDIGKLVAAACELPLGSWKPAMGMVGETIAVDEVVELLHAKIGGSFDVTTVNRSDLLRRAASTKGLGSNRAEIVSKMVSQLVLVMLEDKEGMAILEPTVNRLCPQVKPCSVAEYLSRL
ncbi:MAG: hypothetical protein Q9217_000426 [Psora testacea]